MTKENQVINNIETKKQQIIAMSTLKAEQKHTQWTRKENLISNNTGKRQTQVKKKKKNYGCLGD